MFIILYDSEGTPQIIYLNINQIDALNFTMSLFHASTCFEHKYSSSGSGIITPTGVMIPEPV